jgi:hypothetical protein
MMPGTPLFGIAWTPTIASLVIVRSVVAQSALTTAILALERKKKKSNTVRVMLQFSMLVVLIW